MQFFLSGNRAWFMSDFPFENCGIARIIGIFEITSDQSE